MTLLGEVVYQPGQAKACPLLLEIPVSPLTAPYLVTATRSLMWLEESPRGVVRTAMRPVWEPEKTFPAMVREIAFEGDRRGWEGHFPMNPKGIQAAVARMRTYGIQNFELLISPGSGAPPQLPAREVSWVPAGSGVVVPMDRSYLGIVFRVGAAAGVVVHNPSRAMAVLGPWPV